MDAGLARHRWKVILEPWRVILLTGCAVFFAVLAVDRGPEGASHEAMMTALSDLDVEHASLQRDILQARSGLLRNYDALVDAIVRAKAAVGRLEHLLAATHVSAELSRRHMDLLAETLAYDEALAETFKTRNALLQNSIAIFNRTLARIHRNPNQEVQRAIASSNDLGNLMMRFSADPDQALAREIRAQLHAMLTPDVANLPELRALNMHGNMIVTTLPTVNESVQLLQSSDLPLQVRALRRDYLESFGDLSERAYWTRVFLGSASALLCLGVSLLVYRLKSRTELLTQRLAFETALGDAKDYMAEFSTEDFGDALFGAADSIASFFKALSWRLVIIDLETGEVQIDYSTAGPTDSPFAGLLEEAVAEMRGGDRQSAVRARLFHRNLRSQQDLAYSRDALSSGIIVGAEMNDEPALIFMLDYAEIRPRALDEEISLLHSALEAFAHEVRLNRGRHERMALEHRLEHSQRLEAIGTLAGGIAHEFNNILGAIMGYGEMALQALRRPSPVKNYVSEIIVAGGRAKQVVDQILTFSRKRERLSKPFDTAAALADMLPLLRASLSEEFALDVGLPDKPLVVVGHPIDLQQIVFNLCRNAAEASGFCGTAQVVLKAMDVPSHRILSHGEIPAGRYALLTVSDHGYGIAEGILPQIFEPFFTTKSERGGTGLGLATVHGSATALGGQINVHSKVGSGTRFELFFPRSHAAATPLSQFSNVTEPPLGTGQTVVILEADAGLRMMYEEKLAALGYEPLGFRHPDDITRWLAAGGAADCVLLDMASLHGAGLSLTDLRAELGGIPYVLLMAQGDEGSAGGRRLRQEGALAKPVNSKDLALAIHERVAGRLDQ